MIGHYLMFDRNCEEALKVYETAFGAKITKIQRYGDMPPDPAFPVSEEDRNLVLNASFTIDGNELMCADSTRKDGAGSNMYVSFMSDVNAVQKAWDILKEDGEIHMDLAPSFFAASHGSLKDRFGISWMFTGMK